MLICALCYVTGIVLNDARAASIVANGGTRCLKLSRARVAEVMHNNLAGLEAHFEDIEAKYQARKAQLEGALQYDISSRALHIKFGRAGGSTQEDEAVDAKATSLKGVSGRLAAECKLLPADGGVGEPGSGHVSMAPQGASVNVLRAKGEWWEVEVQESGERGFVAARLVTVGASGDEDDASRLSRRVALLRQSVRCLDGLTDADVTLLAMCLDSTVVGECEPLLRQGEYPSSLLLLEAGRFVYCTYSSASVDNAFANVCEVFCSKPVLNGGRFVERNREIQTRVRYSLRSHRATACAKKN